MCFVCWLLLPNVLLLPPPERNLTGGNVCSYNSNTSETQNNRNRTKKFSLSFCCCRTKNLKFKRMFAKNIASKNLVDILLLGLSFSLHLIYKINGEHGLSSCVASTFEVKLSLRK